MSTKIHEQKHPVVDVPGWGKYEIRLEQDGRFRAYSVPADVPTSFEGETVLGATMRLAEARRGYAAQQGETTAIHVTTLGAKR